MWMNPVIGTVLANITIDLTSLRNAQLPQVIVSVNIYIAILSSLSTG